MIENSLGANLSGPHGHACSVGTISSDMAIFRDSVSTVTL